MEKIKWWWFLAAIPLLIIFRMAGFIGNFWLGLGVLSIGAGVVLLQMIPASKLNILSKIFIIWAVIVIGLPMTKAAFMKNTPPLTKEALEERGSWSDLQSSEKIRPHGLIGLEVFRRWSDRMEKSSASYFFKKYEALQDDYWAGRISYEQMMAADRELRRKMETNIRWREEASDFLTRNQPGKLKPGFSEKASSWMNSQTGSFAGKLLLLGLAGAALLLISAIPKIPGQGVVGFLGGLFLFAAILVGAASLFFPQIATATINIGETKTAVATPPVATNYFPRLINIEPWEVEIRPDKLSELYQRLDLSTVCYDTGDLKAHDIMVYDAVSGTYLGRFSEIKVSQLRKGVRFIGPAGTIKRTG